MRRTLRKEVPAYRCRDCRHAYDWHENNPQGEPFLCRCRHYQGGKYSKFLEDYACKHFQPSGRV